MIFLKDFLLQMLFTIGVIFIFGFLIALCNRIFYKNWGRHAMMVAYITGAIGTPIHECSHALFCLIFFHKILEIKLFQVNAEDGTLGYIKHSYNPKNLYQMIGNFFIGIAPIICISALLLLPERFLVPDMFFKIQVIASRNITSFAVFGNNLLDIFVTMFSYANQPLWWVFIFIGLLLCLHMNLSGADIKGALIGLIFIVLLFLAVDGILMLVGANAIDSFTTGIVFFGSYLISILFVALILSIVAVLISFIAKIFIKE